MTLDKWEVSISDDGQYIYINRTDQPGQLHIKAEDEGYVIDAWTYDGVGDARHVDSLAIFYQDLEN